MPKYSIIVPVRNAAAYLPTCIETVLSQQYDDFELIISNNHSSDGTETYLQTINHPKLKTLIPPKPCCMGEHFEWALAQATGEWLIFLGADDGLLPYFFELADSLTAIAEREGIRAIASRRAYYFWPGCESLYGKTAVSFIANKKHEVRHSLPGTLNALFGIGSYFELPQMYSNSLFHRSLIEEAVKIQGCVFTSITPDANLAALACGLESRYLYSRIPLGWVGSSPASNGFSVSLSSNTADATEIMRNAAQSRANDFFALNSKSALCYDSRLGNPRLSSTQFLFWDVLNKTATLRSKRMNRFLFSKNILAFVTAKELESAKKDRAKVENAKNVACNFGISWPLAKTLCVLITLISLPFKVRRRLRDLFCRCPGPRLSYSTKAIQSMPDAARAITREMRRRNILPQRDQQKGASCK
ncbi:MAG: glycosyltransferase family A protein [Kiritimatiellae bacterium]|nr:glycosyltransferase family A protein [Kiritimatiellia bacterium]